MVYVPREIIYANDRFESGNIDIYSKRKSEGRNHKQNNNNSNYDYTIDNKYFEMNYDSNKKKTLNKQTKD